MESINGLEGWLQIATSTGFVGLSWYLIAIALPRMQDKFDAFAREQQQRFESQLDRQNTHHETVVKSMLERHERMVAVLTKSKFDAMP